MGRRPLFSRAQLVELLDVLRENCASYSFNVYAYCFMPDHVHLELVGLSHQSNLIPLLPDFKGISITQARGLKLRKLWQKRFL